MPFSTGSSTFPPAASILAWAAGSNLVDLDGELLGDLAVAKDLHELIVALDDASGDEALGVHDVAVLELVLEAGDIDRRVLDAAVVA